MAARRPRAVLIGLSAAAMVLFALVGSATALPAVVQAASTGTVTSQPDTPTTCIIDGLYVRSADFTTACPEATTTVSMTASPAPGLLSYPEQFAVTGVPPSAVSTQLPQYLLYPGTPLTATCPGASGCIQMYGSPAPSNVAISWTVGDITVDFETPQGTTAAQVEQQSPCTGGLNHVPAANTTPEHCVVLTSGAWNHFAFTYSGSPKTYAPQMEVNWSASLPFSNQQPEYQLVHYQTQQPSTFYYQSYHTVNWTPYWVSISSTTFDDPYTEHNYKTSQRQGSRYLWWWYNPASNQTVHTISTGGTDAGGDDNTSCDYGSGSSGWSDENTTDPGATYSGEINNGGWAWDSSNSWGCFTADNHSWAGCCQHDKDDQNGGYYDYFNLNDTTEYEYDWWDQINQYAYNDPTVNWDDQKYKTQATTYWTEIPYAQPNVNEYDNYTASVPETIVVNQWYTPSGSTSSGFGANGCPDIYDLSNPNDYNTPGNPASGLLPSCQPNFNLSNYTIVTTCAGCGTYTQTYATWDDSGALWSHNRHNTAFDNQTADPVAASITYEGLYNYGNFIAWYDSMGHATGSPAGDGGPCTDSHAADTDGSDENGGPFNYRVACPKDFQWKATSPHYECDCPKWTDGPYGYTRYNITNHPFSELIDDIPTWVHYQTPHTRPAPYDTLTFTPNQVPPLYTGVPSPDVSFLILIIQQLQPVQNATSMVHPGAVGKVEG